MQDSEKKYDLDSAENGEEGPHKVSEFRPHIMLLDIMMPGIDGYENCRQIKSGSEEDLTHVILVSGKGTTEERIAGYEAGADDYIVKPFDHNELLSKVHMQFRLWQSQRELSKAKERLEL